MRVHTNDFKEELKVFGRQIKGKIIYYPSYDLVSESDNNILTEADLQVISEQANYDEPIEISEEDIFSISVIKNGNLLQSLMKEFDFETKEELNIGSVVNPQFGLLVNGDYEYLNYGNYIINSKEFNMDTETWSYVCYDKMLFSMVKYSGLSNIEYPITIKQFINKLCDKIGLEFEDSEFVNQEQLIYEDLYKNMNVTYRDIFDEISKIVAGNLLINDNDKLKVGYVNKAIGESEEKSGSSLEIIDGQNAELVNFEIEGKTVQNGTPSPTNPIELVSVGYKNYFEAEYLQTTANTNINANLYKNTYTLSLETKQNFGGVIYIQLYKNNTLITTNGHLLNTSSAVSFSTSSYWYYFPNIPNGNKLTFTLDDDYSLKIALSNATGSQKAFLVKGTQLHNYIPYGKYGVEVKATNNNNESKTYLYTLDNPLRSIGDTKDLLYIKNGKLYVDRKIGSTVLDGSENWKKYNNYLYYYNESFILSPTTSLVMPDLISDNFTISIFNDLRINPKIYMSANQLGSPNNQRGVCLYVNDYYSDVSTLKTWLSTHNTEVQYILAEPYTEELGEVEIPSTYKGITYIETTDEIEPSMNITYVKEFEAINEEYLKDTNVTMAEKIGVINSVAILDTDNNLEYIQEDTESIKTNEMTRITITNNLLALNGDTNTIALNILNKLNGLYYYANDLQTTGVCYYDYLDLFNVEARGNTYQCLLLNNEITITQGIEEHIFTEKLEEAQTSSNEYTTSVMTNKQIQFNINQQEGRIESKVEKDGVISAINQSAEEIQINANKISLEGKEINLTSDNIVIESNNFSVDEEGKITATAGDIGGFLTTSTSFSKELYGLYNYNYFDMTLVAMYIINRIALDTNLSDILDANDSGDIQASDYITIRNIIQGTVQNTKEVSGKFELNSNDPKNCVAIKDKNDKIITSLGLGGINTTYLISDNIVCGKTGTSYNDFTGATINGNTGNITCVSLTQTSKEESKKNFKKYKNALEQVKNTDIYEYNLKTEDNNEKKHIGFVIGKDFNYSHDITATNENNEEIGVDTYSMVSVLWQAVKEQQEEINELKEMIKYGKY